MSQVSGIIKKKSVKAGLYGDKVSFLVGGNWLSAFATDKKLSQEVKDLLKNLSEGDEADFEVVENQGKDGKTYLNITGIVKVTRLGGDTGEDMDYAVGHPEDKKEDVRPTGQPKDSRDSMMRLSYCKDIMIAFPGETEADLFGRVEMVKKMALLMGE